MSAEKSKFVCRDCQNEMVKWVGRCSSCHSWNSFEEVFYNKNENQKDPVPSRITRNSPQIINTIKIEPNVRLKTGMSEFDRIIDGGLTLGSITLITGEPGVGKSTMLMQIAAGIIRNISGGTVLYTSGEESMAQLAIRAKRLKLNSEKLYIYNETSWQRMLKYIKEIKPKVFILDSIQTTLSENAVGNAGSMSQVKEIIFEIMDYAKALDLTCVVIGHITKNGVIAGPKTLEHMVDTVISFEREYESENRLLRVIKNRFGNTNEVGFLTMSENGLVPFNNENAHDLDYTNSDKSFGHSLSCIIEGSRCIYVEVQALVVENKSTLGRKINTGQETNRLTLLLAIIDKYFEIALSPYDTYLNIVGGYKLTGRETDLSMIASLLSSYYSMKIENEVIMLGEVGLTGEVRCVPQLKKRITELEQRKFKKIILSKRSANKYKNEFKIKLIGITRACELKRVLFKT